jgi:hypothetical protein
MVLRTANTQAGAIAQISTKTSWDIAFMHEVYDGPDQIAVSQFNHKIRGSPIHSNPYRGYYTPVAPWAEYVTLQTPRESVSFGQRLSMELILSGNLLAGLDIQMRLAPVNIVGVIDPGDPVNNAYYTDGIMYAMLNIARLTLSGSQEYENSNGDVMQLKRLSFQRADRRLYRPLGFGSVAQRTRWARETQNFRAPLLFSFFDHMTTAYDTVRARNGRLELELFLRSSAEIFRAIGTQVGAATPGAILAFDILKSEIKLSDGELAQIQQFAGSTDDLDVIRYRYPVYRYLTVGGVSPSLTVQITAKNMVESFYAFARRDASSNFGAGGREWFDWSGVTNVASGLPTYAFESWTLSNGGNTPRFAEGPEDSLLNLHRRAKSQSDESGNFFMYWTAASKPYGDQPSGGVQLSGETNTTLEFAFPAGLLWSGTLGIIWFSWMTSKYTTINGTGAATLQDLYAH